MNFIIMTKEVINVMTLFLKNHYGNFEGQSYLNIFWLLL